MSDYPKVIERPYKVYMGEAEYVWMCGGKMDFTEVNYAYKKSFRLESDAEAYAERISEDYEFVKIEKKKENS